jgi:hypothetical protein
VCGGRARERRAPVARQQRKTRGRRSIERVTRVIPQA